MATITIELDDDLYDATALLAEASAEVPLNVYVIEAIAYTNRMRMGLPETRQQISRWWEKKHKTVERVAERCNDQIEYEHKRRERGG